MARETEEAMSDENIRTPEDLKAFHTHYWVDRGSSMHCIDCGAWEHADPMPVCSCAKGKAKGGSR